MILSRFIVKRLGALYFEPKVQSFQLCHKSILKVHFSSSKSNPPPNSDNQNTSSEPQKQSKSQPKTKSQTARQRLIEIQELRRQQQYQQKLQKINLSTGSFNSFTQYLLLQKHKFFYIFLAAFITFLLIDERSPFCFKTMGVIKDPFTGKNKFFVVNQHKENTLEKCIIGILEKSVKFWTQEEMKGDNSMVNKVLQKKLETALNNLSQKYGIELKKFPKQEANYQIAQSSDEIIASVFGSSKLVVSTKLLKMSQQSLESLLLLMHSLHSRCVHLQNISFWQRSSLRQSIDTQNMIKIEKTFISNTFSAQSVQQTIQLIAKKYGKDENEQNLIQKSMLKALKELFDTKKDGKFLPEYDLRIRLKNSAELLA